MEEAELQRRRDLFGEKKTFPAEEGKEGFEIRWVAPEEQRDRSKVPNTEGWSVPKRSWSELSAGFTLTYEFQRTWVEKRTFLANFCSQFFLDWDAANNVSAALRNPRFEKFVGYVVRTDGTTEPVCFAVVDARVGRGTAAELVFLCTHPNHYKKGYAARLVAHYENLVKKLDPDVRAIFIAVMNTAETRAFYRKIGYSYFLFGANTPAYPASIVAAYSNGNRDKFRAWRKAESERWGREIPNTVIMYKEIRPISILFARYATARAFSADLQAAWVSRSLEKLSL